MLPFTQQDAFILESENVPFKTDIFDKVNPKTFIQAWDQ